MSLGKGDRCRGTSDVRAGNAPHGDSVAGTDHRLAKGEDVRYDSHAGHAE